MVQYDLINKIVEEYKKAKFIDLAFLCGSFARKEEDELSNIDLYIRLINTEEEKFFSTNYNIISRIKPVVYYKEIVKDRKVDSIRILLKDKEIINVNLFLLSKDEIVVRDEIMVLYDPLKLEKNVKYSLGFSASDIGSFIDDISLLSYDFMRYYLRNDLAIQLKKVQQIEEKYVSVLRYCKDNSNSKLGHKDILSVLTREERIKYIKILKTFKVDTLKECVCLMLDDISDRFKDLDLEVSSHYDYDFFMVIKRKIQSLL